MDMHIERTGGQHMAFTRNNLGRNPHDEIGINTRHNIGITRFANTGDAPIFNPNIRLVYPRIINDKRIGNHEIQRPILRHTRGLAHTIAQHLAPAKFAFIAINCIIILHFNDEMGIAQLNAVSPCGTVHTGISDSINLRHLESP